MEGIVGNFIISLDNTDSLMATVTVLIFFIPLYLQSVLGHSANCVKIYARARRNVLTSASCGFLE
jgi:hypothetical protein